jgi:hypothetical protein
MKRIILGKKENANDARIARYSAPGDRSVNAFVLTLRERPGETIAAKNW